MRTAHIGQEGGRTEGLLIPKAVEATLTRGWWAYVQINGTDRYIGGPHATELGALIEAHDWVVGELRARQRRQVLKLHAGEHAAITDDAAHVELAKAVG